MSGGRILVRRVGTAKKVAGYHGARNFAGLATLANGRAAAGTDPGEAADDGRSELATVARSRPANLGRFRSILLFESAAVIVDAQRKSGVRLDAWSEF